MSPSDRPDASLLTDAALLEELRRRREARAAGVCDFCARRAVDVPPCGEPARHQAAAQHQVMLWAKLDAQPARLRGDASLVAEGAPPTQPLVSCADTLQAELVRDLVREVGRQTARDGNGPTLAHLMTEIGEVATALLERGAPQRGELVQVAAVALGWAEATARRYEAKQEHDRHQREAAQDIDHAARVLEVQPAGPAAFTAMAVALRADAARAEHRRGGLQYSKANAANVLALGELGAAHLTPHAADALAAIRVGLRVRKGGVALSFQRAVALADYLQECALVAPRVFHGKAEESMEAQVVT
jgi:hypothetical protein